MRPFVRLGLLVALGGVVTTAYGQEQAPAAAPTAQPAPTPEAAQAPAAAPAAAAKPEEKKEEKKEAPKTDDKKVERIVVTGTHIRKIDTESVSNVKIIDKKEVEKSGQSSVADFVQTLAVSAEGSYSSSTVNDTRGTVSQVNLRGLGAQNTLVLLDGRRLPDEGGEGVVDLSVIPMAAIERIDVLLDSASAIYGSDATGGVINIITRKNYTGTTFLARGTQHSMPGGEERLYNMVTGTSNEKYSTITTLSYRHVEPIFYRDRDWTKEGLSMYSFPANYQTIKDGAWHKSPNCPADNQEIDMRGTGVLGCSYNYGATSAFSPESTQISLLNNSEYKITNRLSFFSSLTAARNVNKWNMAPNAGEFTISKEDIAANPDIITDLGIPTENTEDGILIAYRTLPWGLRTWEEDNTSFGATLGLKGELGDAWNWEVSGSNVRGKKFSINPEGFLRENGLVDAISEGSYNPFSTDLSAIGAVADELSYQPFVITTTEMRTYNGIFSGEAFELPGGPVGIAVGVNRIEQEYQKQIDRQSERGDIFGVEEDKGDSGDREVNAVFAELALPVIKGIDLQLAVRHDKYSDFGSTTNPKVGVSVRPLQSLLIRANWSTGFKAPTLKDLYLGQQVGLANVQDLPTCRANGIADADCPLSTEIRAIARGNRDLKEETSQTYNMGVAFEPLAGNSVSFDYWNTEIKDIVSTVDSQDLLEAIADGRSLGKSSVTRDAAGNLSEINVETLNLGTKKEAGYDIGLELSALFAETQRVGFGSTYSAKAFSKVTPVPGSPEKDELGERGKPRWRLSNKVSYGIASHALNLSQNIIAQQKTASKVGHIGSYTTYNANYTYTHAWNGSVSVGALNFMNTDFPMDMTERAGDDRRVKELYSPNGRTVYAQVTQSF